MEETISLNEILEVIKKRLKIIIASTIVVTLLVAIISLFILTPIYEASSQFIVNEPNTGQINQFDSNTIRTNVEVINTYNVIITSPVILDDVIDKFNLEYSANSLANKVSVSSAHDSQVVTVTVADPNQESAAKLANEIVTTFKNKIPEIMNVDNVSVLTTAEVIDNPTPVNPNVKLNIAIGLVLGLMLGVGIAFLIEYFDTSVKTKEDIEKKLGVPVIGMISTVEPEDLQEEKNMAQRRKG